MRFSSNFEQKEWLGREALKEIKILYPEIFRNNIEFTPDMCVYDAFYFIYDENFKIKKRVFIEIKIRDIEYDNYILEWKKWNDINNLAKNDLMLNDDEYEILYINFTPESTYLWKVKDMNKEDLITKKMNKVTSISRTDKKDKKTWLLEKDSGKRLNYILNEKLLINKTYDNYLSNKVKEVIIKKPGLEDILFY